MTLDHNAKNQSKDSVNLKNGSFSETAYQGGMVVVEISGYVLNFVNAPKTGKNGDAIFELGEPKAKLTLRFGSGTWDLSVQKAKMWDKIDNVNGGLTFRLTVNGNAYSDTVEPFYNNKLKYVE